MVLGLFGALAVPVGPGVGLFPPWTSTSLLLTQHLSEGTIVARGAESLPTLSRSLWKLCVNLGTFSANASGGKHLYALLLIYRMIQMITIRRRKMQKTTQLMKSSTYPSLFSRIVLFEDVLGDERSFIHINKYSTHPLEDLYPRQLLR